MKGKKTGGRLKGTPNKRSDEARALIERALKGQSPLDVMARLARELLDGKHKLCRPLVVDKCLELIEDRGLQLRLAADLLSEVAQYHSPKRKAIEVSGADGQPIELFMEIPVKTTRAKR